MTDTNKPKYRAMYGIEAAPILTQLDYDVSISDPHAGAVWGMLVVLAQEVADLRARLEVLESRENLRRRTDYLGNK